MFANVKTISDEIMKSAGNYVIETRKNIEDFKKELQTVSEILEDLPQNEVENLAKQIKALSSQLVVLKKKVI